LAEQNARDGMTINFFPKPGHVLICDFSDFEQPEINKIRPLIVVSPRLPHRSEIVTVVPISTSAPLHEFPFVVRLLKNYHPAEDDGHPSWAKCDMIMNIARRRLNGFKIGKRKWATPRASDDDLTAVRHGVIYGLGMGHLLVPKE
jgi:mRNA interferase MazF